MNSDYLKYYNAFIKSIGIIFIILLSSSNVHSNPNCDNLKIGVANWQSASFLAHLDKVNLEKQFNCSIEMISGEPGELLELFFTGQLDILPEYWESSNKNYFDLYSSKSEIKYQSVNIFNQGGFGGIWLASKKQKNEPLYAEDLDLVIHEFSNSNRPLVFHGCPKSWGCYEQTEKFIKDYNLIDKGFTIYTPSSEMDMSLNLYEKSGKSHPWFGYYWSPTSLVDSSNLQLINFYSNQEYFPKENVFTLINQKVSDQSAILNYFQKRVFDNAQLISILDWQEKNHATFTETVYYSISLNE